MASADDMSCFTFTWKIENFSLFMESDKNRLISPAWKTETIGDCTWWRLLVYHRVSHFQLFLESFIKGKVLDRWQLFLIASCGEIPVEASIANLFNIETNSIFFENGEPKFPNDILTLRCKMWKKTMKAGKCSHHSVLHKLDYSWSRKKESSDSFFYTYIEKNNFLLYIKVWENPDKDTHTIVIGSVQGLESYASIAGCRLLPKYGGRVVEDEIIFPSFSWRCKIENFVETNPDRGLKFQLNCLVQKNLIPQLFVTESSLLDSSGMLNTDLLQIYKEETFSDTTLTTEGKSFPAHRSILAARSPVFNAMLKKKEMSEGREGVIVIDDIDSVTLNRMLVFLYSDSLEEMNWEEATSLYYAADKYAIQFLKQKCADVLKAGLAEDNACQALILADTYSDQEVMRCTIDFIRDHQEVISSAEWETLEENHSKLAAKSLRKVIVKK